MYRNETSLSSHTDNSLLDHHFSESDTSLAITSINNTYQNKCQDSPSTTYNDSYMLMQNKNVPSLINRRSGDTKDKKKSLLVGVSFNESPSNRKPGDCSNHSDKINVESPILDDLFNTPTLGSNFDYPNSPVTPVTPYLDQVPFSKSPHIYGDTKEITKYPLNDDKLESFVLIPEVFDIKLVERLGKGGNAYVYACELSTTGSIDNVFSTAIKIPINKSKVKYILQEAKMAIKLREFQNTWFQTECRVFPFIDCYGLYYIDRQKFDMIKPREAFPCLVMKRMTYSLTEFVSTQSKEAEADKTKIHLTLWWKLCQTLLDALKVLKTLGLVHCDLKTDNVMITEYNSTLPIESQISQVLFKVIDFSSTNEIQGMVKCPDMTLQFTAPELLDFSKHPLPTPNSDSFSAGLILLEAATGSKPYSAAGYDHFYLLSVIKEGKVMEWLSPEDMCILNANPDVKRVLEMFLIDRLPVESISSFIQTL
ncbi:unnamed protein product [Pichia kudriavzevii]